MSNGSIETIGVSELKTCLNKTKVVDTSDIKEGDKEISWDGDIYVFKDESCSTESFLGRIPTQIKTRETDEVVDSFPIKKDDLKNYLIHGNLLYFLINVTNYETFIYYLPLYKWDINKALESIGDKKSKTFKFEIFPKNDYKKIKKILYDFIEESKNHNIIPGVNSLVDFLKDKKIANLTFNLDVGKNFSIEDLNKAINEQKPYLKVYNSSTKTMFVVDKLENVRLELTESIYANVGAGDETFFNNVLVQKMKNKIIIKHQHFLIVIKNGELEVEYSNFETMSLKERYCIESFNAKLISTGKLNIDDGWFQLNVDCLDNTFVETAKARQSFYDKLFHLLKELKILKQPIIKSITKEEMTILLILYYGIVLKKPFNGKPLASKIYYWELFGLKIYTYVEVDKNGDVGRMYNWDYAEIQTNDGTSPLSPFYLLSDKSRFFEIDNIDYDKMINTLFKKKPSQKNLAGINLIGINMIELYDESPNDKLLDCSIRLYKKIRLACQDNVMYTINYYQLLLRKNNKLSDAEKNALADISAREKDYFILFACNTLLGIQIMAKKYLSLISEEEKTTGAFKTIYKLYQIL